MSIIATVADIDPPPKKRDNLNLRVRWFCDCSPRTCVRIFGILDLILTFVWGVLSVLSLVYVYILLVGFSLEVNKKAKQTPDPPHYIEQLTNSIVGKALHWVVLYTAILTLFFLMELWLFYLLCRSLKKENKKKFTSWLNLRIVLLALQSIFSFSWLIWGKEISSHPLTYTLMASVIYRVGELFTAYVYLKDLNKDEIIK